MPPRLYTSLDPVVRLRVAPDAADGPRNDGAPILGPDPRQRPPGSRRPHTDATVARVRRYVEQTTLTLGEIAARTGVGRASICRWSRDGAWQRPPFAPRATDTVPRARAGQKLKLRLLVERLRVLAERHIRALEEAPETKTEALLAALNLLRAARLESIGRRRRVVLVTGAISDAERDEVTRKALRELEYGGVETEHLPAAALSLIVDARLPAEDSPALRPRGSRRR